MAIVQSDSIATDVYAYRGPVYGYGGGVYGYRRRSVWVWCSARRSVWYGGGVYGYDPLSIESMGIDSELDCVTRGTHTDGTHDTHRGSRPQRPQPTGPSPRTPCWGLMRDSATRGRGTRALKTMSTTTYQPNTPFLRLSCLPACRTTRHGQTRGQFRKSTCTIIQPCGPTTSLVAIVHNS